MMTDDWFRTLIWVCFTPSPNGQVLNHTGNVMVLPAEMWTRFFCSRKRTASAKGKNRIRSLETHFKYVLGGFQLKGDEVLHLSHQAVFESSDRY